MFMFLKSTKISSKFFFELKKSLFMKKKKKKKSTLNKNQFSQELLFFLSAILGVFNLDHVC